MSAEEVRPLTGPGARGAPGEPVDADEAGAPGRAGSEDGPRPSIGELLRLVRILLAEGLRGQVPAVVAVIGLQVVGVVAGLATFLVLIAHVQLQLGSADSRFSMLLPVRSTDTPGLLLSAAVALSLGGVGAFSAYAARRSVLRLAREFHHRAIIRALAALERGVREETVREVRFISASHDPRHLAPVYARYVATAFRILLESSQPMVVCLATLPLLVYIDPLLTVLLVPLALFALAPLRRLGGQAATVQGRLLSGLSEVNPRLVRLGQKISDDVASGTARAAKDDVDETGVEAMLDDFYRPMLLLQRASSSAQLLQTVGFVWIFVIVGFGVGRSGTSWASLLTFLVALRFLAGAARTLSISAVSFARFVPALETYMGFVFAPARPAEDRDRGSAASLPPISS